MKGWHGTGHVQMYFMMYRWYINRLKKLPVAGLHITRKYLGVIVLATDIQHKM